jgi:chromosome segregation protein
MRLKSLTLKGFKSFPDRTILDFGPGVSVVVGPNGSGKSNVTDAVLWAMGEQSPLAVRGQSMQDVIFGGGHGVQARNAAEVEIVLDNSDGTVELPLSEISIVRRLDRTGEGGYRLNGARCRLTDVIEVLSDTGLGKETHSVISQGRVEAIVTSKARDRRMLIEEAAGLGKHRKRRRRAQLKLERTQENLDRALDVEREARTRLRPLKRQAEAAELHERLERQTLQARLELARDCERGRALELAASEQEAATARGARQAIEERLQAVIDRRGLAETALAERAERHDALSRRVYDARAARERVGLRAEQASASADLLQARIAHSDGELSRLQESAQGGPGDVEVGAEERRVSELEQELAELEATGAAELERELGGLVGDGERQAQHVAELEQQLRAAEQARARGDELVEQAREGSVWSATWQEVRRVIEEGVRRVLAQPGERERLEAAGEVAARAEHVARGVVEYALKGVRAAEDVREQAEADLRAAERRCAQAREQHGRTQWLIEQRRAAPLEGPLAVRRAQLGAELESQRRRVEQLLRERRERDARADALRDQRAADVELLPRAQRLVAALHGLATSVADSAAAVEAELEGDRAAGEGMATELRECAREEAELQAQLRGAGELVTSAEVAAQRLRDQLAEASSELVGIASGLGLDLEQIRAEQTGPLDAEQAQALDARVERLERRRAQLGPVNPLAQQEYSEAVEHVEEMEGRRADLETALRELRSVIRDTDRQIQETFQETFDAAARNFEELVGDVFPGGSGRLRLVSEEQAARPVLGGQSLQARSATTGVGLGEGAAASDQVDAGAGEAASEEAAEHESELEQREHEDLLGVEIEVTPAGKATKRLSLLSGGEKSMTALAFLFAVFLARPCPFYILDEVEAALDDLNLDRFLALLRRYADRAQFIVITHQKRTMEAADWLFGVSMGGDGVSKVLSRRLPAEQDQQAQVAEVAEVAEVA